MFDVTLVASRFRVLVSRGLAFIGFRDDSFLLLVATFIGVITAAAAVGFHELINSIRDTLYRDLDPKFLYSAGSFLLILWPMLGGLIVGFIANVLVRDREGSGVIDVLESVVRSSGFIKPTAAFEKIITSAVTIGSGGSGGAEGPIVQIGAAIASGMGQFFRVARSQMPLIIGCGTAAGISAIFNSPMGGLLFTLEVVLLDFSIRTVTPVIIASVVADVTTQAIFRELYLHHRIAEQKLAIFNVNSTHFIFTWPQMANFLALGAICGLAAVALTLFMRKCEHWFEKVAIPRFIRPAVGGALVGVIGVIYVMIFGWLMLRQPKPIPAIEYPMPAFFGDGYGFIQQLFTTSFYNSHIYSERYLLLLLAFLCIAKIVGTCLTIGSGGSGGIIAPALFVGAVVGGFMGIILHHASLFAAAQPHIYALVGMAAVLAAVVHAPLAAILILLDLTGDYQLALPAMLASIFATGMARRIYPESIYTMTLRERGVRTSGGSSDQILLRRMHVEQVTLDPAAAVSREDPLQRVLDLSEQMHIANFPVLDKDGYYIGMLTEDDINVALMQREAVPLLLVEEVMRHDIPFVRNSDDLSTVLDIFSRHEIDHLPVCLAQSPGKIIGLISRAGLMRTYHTKLVE
jgi:CIC family chloride channel protein